jgi:hypothetical protein
MKTNELFQQLESIEARIQRLKAPICHYWKYRRYELIKACIREIRMLEAKIKGIDLEIFNLNNFSK